jgi:nucleotide-binding universal stress UspA family protein
MATTAVLHREPQAATRGAPSATQPRDAGAPAPIIAGVDGTAGGLVAARTAIAWAKQLAAPIVFVFVRRPPMDGLGAPFYGRRVEAETLRARSALSAALAAAETSGVNASAEILDGPPARRLSELANLRKARLLVTGPRKRHLRRSVSRMVLSTADRPVLVAAAA